MRCITKVPLKEIIRAVGEASRKAALAAERLRSEGNKQTRGEPDMEPKMEPEIMSDLERDLLESMAQAQRGEFERVHTPEDIAAYKARQQSRSDGHGQD